MSEPEFVDGRLWEIQRGPRRQSEERRSRHDECAMCCVWVSVEAVVLTLKYLDSDKSRKVFVRLDEEQVKHRPVWHFIVEVS